MMKNIQWDTKTKIKTALIIFVTVFVGIFHESVGRDWTSANMILTQLAASAAFAAFVAVTVNHKGYSLFSTQGIAMVVAVGFALGVVASRDFFNHEALLMLLYAPLLLICSQVTVLTPVAAVISVFLVLKHDGVAVMCLPAAVGASLIYLSSSVKESAVWKKIVFAVSELVIIAAAIYSYWLRRYFLSVHSLVTEIRDSIGLAVAVALFVALAVISIIKKRPLGEILGCVAAAAFAVVPMFMYSAYALPVSSAILMILPVICQNGLPAEQLGEKALKCISSKFKK